MSMRKRLLRAGSAFCLLLLLLGVAARGAKTADTPQTEKEKNVCRVRMTYPVYDDACDVTDLKDIEQAVNEISVEKIGVAVELVPVNMHEAEKDYLLRLSKGEALDLMLVRGHDVTTYINKGMLHPMNTYLKRNASYLYFQDGALDGAYGKQTQQGRLYGIANIPRMPVHGYGLWVSSAVLAEVGVKYEEGHVYSLDELTRIFGRLKRKYPDSYPLGQITARRTSSGAGIYVDLGDALGADMLTGVVKNESDVVENPFASEEYYEFLSYMESWYENEYIYPDSVTYDSVIAPLLEENMILSYPGVGNPGMFDLMMGEATDFVCLQTAPARETDADEADFWTIPSTSRYPAEAMKFLDLCYSDIRIVYLLNYGIVGRHYEIADKEDSWARPVMGEGRVGNGFYNPFAGIGNCRMLCGMGMRRDREKEKTYVERALDKGNRYEGFVYETAAVSGEMDEVRKVVATYVPVLESGSVDLDENYQDFLTALEEAGIDRIIADKQRQLDEWLERHGE
ncbi:MAG: ABC transporter substrate-binding protein [Ruminococcus sp.]|nr:ABC transporter substrate-binding protein [Ruminococcus sp.]